MKDYTKFKGKFAVDGVEYLYNGGNSDWSPVKGFTPPTPTVWRASTMFNGELRATLGSSEADCVARLKDLIRRTNDYNKQ